MKVMSSGSRVRVRMVPAAHAYVHSLLPVHPTGADVVHLPDPPVPGAPPGQWWPHPVLEPGWVRAHADEQDVVHAHFGMEGRTTEQLARWLDTLEDVGLPLVHTVHDLVNPHLVEQTRHREHLALLVERSAGLLTLTEGAARAVQRDHGRRPLVVPHPHVVPLELVGAPRPPRTGPLRVGLHLKSLRTNIAPMRVLPALLEAVEQLDGQVHLEVRAHPDVLEPFAQRHDPALAGLLAELRAAPPAGVDVVVSPRLSDERLWAYLAGLDVSVLAYAWGTHSGWVEACRDVGTWALAPAVGFLAEQGGVLTWGPPEVPASVARIVELLEEAATPPPRVTRAEREAERDLVAARHAEVYAAVLAGERVDASTGGGEVA
ncbi:glycosyltransferase family 1 protein [Ornithinimicrobium cerasi]|uniref:Glycosyltransferase involved in cell wall bisynthesis n=1 Tax=Ornithinimicrobium cerasi TaxID=2248773 RepID=A0A285VVC8_9MICO|nr:glycosyltransferase family 1 protein [Ornithinimicrobium cerasi]SOC57985.1 Glycosyltransferase involved in cell wall bisynthesis [Ornithinimicrobium cerasi]